MRTSLLAVLVVVAAVALLWSDPRQPAQDPAPERLAPGLKTPTIAQAVERVTTDTRVLVADHGNTSAETAAALVELCGYVRDQEARPIVGAQLLAVGFHRNVAVTDEDGWFRLPAPIRSGTSLILRASCARHLDVEVSVTVQPDSPASIVLERAPRISGTLVDPRGTPIQGYRLQALGESGNAIAFGMTDVQGHFDLLRRDATSGGRVIVSELFTYGHGFLEEHPLVPWGTEGLTLRTQSSGQIEIRVKRADVATPTTAFAVCLLHHQHQGPQGWDVARPVRVTSEDGVARILSTPGLVSFVVIPDEETLQPSEVMSVTVPQYGVCVAHVNVSPGRAQRIRVFDRQTGIGIASAAVQLVVGGADAGNRQDATLPQVSEVLGLRSLTWLRSGVVAKTKTGADGTAVVRFVDPSSDTFLRCEHPQYRSAIVRLVPSNEIGAAEVAMDRGIRIRGSVKPLDILRFKPCVRAVVERPTVVRGKWVTVDVKTGGFDIDVENGDLVRLDLAITMSDGVPVLTANGIAKLDYVTEPVPESIVLDCSDHIPGSVAGRVFVNGSAPTKVRAHRLANGIASPGWAVEAVVGQDGTFVIVPMLVGEWMLSAVAKTVDPFQYRPDFFANCVVYAGKETWVVGDVATATMDMVVCDVAGVPLPEGQQMSLVLKRCPERPFVTKLGAGGVLRVEGLISTESVLAEVQGGPRDKQRGEADVMAKRLVVR